MHKNICLFLSAVAVIATPASALPQKGDEPIAVPRTIKQGIDFVYVDPKMTTVARRRQRPQNWLQRMLRPEPASARGGAPNVMFSELARGLQQYQASWGRLPQVQIKSGAALKRGLTGNRVSQLRTAWGCLPLVVSSTGFSKLWRPIK